MTTPKPFNPVVTMPEPEVIQFQGTDGRWYGFLNDEHEANTISSGEWPLRSLYTAAQLREYAASVARAMVPEGASASLFGLVSTAYGWDSCRAATLSAIDEWEKNDG